MREEISAEQEVGRWSREVWICDIMEREGYAIGPGFLRLRYKGFRGVQAVYAVTSGDLSKQVSSMSESTAKIQSNGRLAGNSPPDEFSRGWGIDLCQVIQPRGSKIRISELVGLHG